MPNTMPVSDLKHYGRVLEKVKPNEPVYLTKNGKAAFSVRRMEDDAEFEKSKAMVHLMTELARGFRSGDEQGWISEEEADAHFARLRDQTLQTQIREGAMGE